MIQSKSLNRGTDDVMTKKERDNEESQGKIEKKAKRSIYSYHENMERNSLFAYLNAYLNADVCYDI